MYTLLDATREITVIDVYTMLKEWQREALWSGSAEVRIHVLDTAIQQFALTILVAMMHVYLDDTPATILYGLSSAGLQCLRFCWSLLHITPNRQSMLDIVRIIQWFADMPPHVAVAVETPPPHVAMAVEMPPPHVAMAVQTPPQPQVAMDMDEDSEEERPLPPITPAPVTTIMTKRTFLQHINSVLSAYKNNQHMDQDLAALAEHMLPFVHRLNRSEEELQALSIREQAENRRFGIRLFVHLLQYFLDMSYLNMWTIEMAYKMLRAQEEILIERMAFSVCYNILMIVESRIIRGATAEQIFRSIRSKTTIPLEHPSPLHFLRDTQTVRSLRESERNTLGKSGVLDSLIDLLQDRVYTSESPCTPIRCPERTVIHQVFAAICKTFDLPAEKERLLNTTVEDPVTQKAYLFLLNAHESEGTHRAHNIEKQGSVFAHGMALVSAMINSCLGVEVLVWDVLAAEENTRVLPSTLGGTHWLPTFRKLLSFLMERIQHADHNKLIQNRRVRDHLLLRFHQGMLGAPPIVPCMWISLQTRGISRQIDIHGIHRCGGWTAST